MRLESVDGGVEGLGLTTTKRCRSRQGGENGPGEICDSEREQLRGRLDLSEGEQEQQKSRDTHTTWLRKRTRFFLS